MDGAESTSRNMQPSGTLGDSELLLPHPLGWAALGLGLGFSVALLHWLGLQHPKVSEFMGLQKLFQNSLCKRQKFWDPVSSLQRPGFGSWAGNPTECFPKRDGASPKTPKLSLPLPFLKVSSSPSRPGPTQHLCPKTLVQTWCPKASSPDVKVILNWFKGYFELI